MDVKKVAKLANLLITEEESNKLSAQFEDTIKVVNVINELDTTTVTPISQVTGLTNVMREDVIETDRVLQIGSYFKVKAIFNAE